jgi:hypothetical protein
MKTLSAGERSDALKDLRRIPGVGPSLAQDLLGLGISRVAHLQKKNPERLYRQLERQVGGHVDRCVLYVFRCAVYFAENTEPEPRLLKWWNWKDGLKKPDHAPEPMALLGRRRSQVLGNQ